MNFPAKDGAGADAQYSIFLIWWSGGEVDTSPGAVLSWTDAFAGENGLTLSQYILNRLPIGLITLDCDYKVTSFSGLAAAVFGADTLGRSLGKPIHDAHSDHARGKIDWLLQQARKDGTSGFASMLINMPNKVLQLRMVQLCDETGVNGYCLIFYDITDLTSRPQETGDSKETPERPFFRLPISSGGRIALMDVDHVSFLQAEGHYTQVYSGSKFYFCNLSLSQLEARLPTDRFVRVHRSFIVNVGRAISVQHRDEQYVISMAGDPERDVPVSRSHVARLRSLLGF